MKRLLLVVAVVGAMWILAGPAGAATDEEIAQTGTIQPSDLVSDRWFGSKADETDTADLLRGGQEDQDLQALRRIRQIVCPDDRRTVARPRVDRRTPE